MSDGARRPLRALAPGLALSILLAQGPAAAQEAPPAATTWSAATPAAPTATPSATPSSVTPPAPTSSEAAAHFDRGVRFYNEGDYMAAVVEFKRAYEIAPSWRVLYNIGQACFQVHDYAQALDALQRFVDQGRDRIPTSQRSIVDSEITDLMNRVGRAQITSNVNGATVVIDDRVVGTTPLGRAVLVSVGVHRVSAIVDGRLPVTQELSVPAGETIAARLDFTDALALATPPSSAPPSSGAGPEPAAEPPSVGPNRVPALAALGAAAAGGAVGVIFGVLALQDKARLDAVCSPAKVCPSSARPDGDAISRDATVSTIGFAVTVVGAAVGLTLWLTAHGAQRRPGASVAAPPRAGDTFAVSFGPGLVAGQF